VFQKFNPIHPRHGYIDKGDIDGGVFSLKKSCRIPWIIFQPDIPVPGGKQTPLDAVQKILFIVDGKDVITHKIPPPFEVE
jgi:hypothetical protein